MKARNHLPWILSGAAAGLALPASGEAAAECAAAGRVLAIEVGGAQSPRTMLEQASMSRGETSLSIENGTPLCIGDKIRTGPDVRVILRLEREGETDVTLNENTTMEVVNEGSVFLSLGRLFASVNGLFDMRVPLFRLAARGTEFEVSVGKAGVDILQLVGDLEIVPTEVARRFGDSQPRLLLAAFSQVSNPNIGERPESKLRRSLKPLTRVVYGVKDLSGQVTSADEESVRKAVDSNAIVVANTRPSLPYKSVLRRFPSSKDRALAFRKARFISVWRREPEAFAQLGDVYLDWTEGTRALRSFKESEKLSRSGAEMAGFHSRLGDAQRLAGDPAAAESSYGTALKYDSSAAWAYTGLGNVYQDLASAAIDGGHADAARQHLSKARDWY